MATLATEPERNVLRIVAEAIRDVPVRQEHREVLEKAADVLEEMSHFQTFDEHGRFRKLEHCYETCVHKRGVRARRKAGKVYER